MHRRHWLAGAAGLIATPLGVRSQPSPPRVGVLFFGSAPDGPNPDPDPADAGLREGLRALGWGEGRNVAIEWRHAEGRPDRLAVLAAELVQGRVDLIVADGPAPIKAPLAATGTLPIVAIGSADPVAAGWAQSLARPGGNIAGLTVTFPELATKQLEILKEARPGLTRVAVLRAPTEMPKSGDSVLPDGARALGLDLQWHDVGDVADFEPAATRARQGRADGLYAIPTNLVVTHRRRLAELVQRQRWRFERPTRFEFVVNLGAARAMGITLPAATLQRADRVIE